MKKILELLLVVIFSSLASALFAQNIGDKTLGTKMPILNGRAFFQFPLGSKNVVRSSGIMSTDPSQNLETRIILDIDKKRMVFFAKEEYKLSEGNLLSEISDGKDYLGYKIEIFSGIKKWVSVLATPAVLDSVNDAILINKLIIKTTDNSIFTIGAYISPSAFKDRAQFAELSKRVFKTLTKGSRTNSRKGGEGAVKIFQTKKSFKIKLPENYVTTVDKKYDFQVIRFHKYRKYADTNWMEALIYTGWFPWTKYKDLGFDINSAEKTSGKILDRPMEWLTFFDNKKSFFLREQKILYDNIADGLIMYVTIESNQKSSIEEVTKIMEGITLTP